MPSNEEPSLNQENLEKCVYDNVKTLNESSTSATFSLDPAIIQLARYFFQRQRERSPTGFPLAYLSDHTEDSSSS